MAKLARVAGTTSQAAYVFLQTTAGAAQTGLVYNSSGLTAYYTRDLGSSTSISLATQTVTGAYSSGGFVEVDSTHQPGLYRFDVPNAVIAAGVGAARVCFNGFSGMQPGYIEFDLENDANTASITAGAVGTILTTQMTEAYATLHTVPTLAQAIFEMRALLAQSSISSTTLTVTKIDGSTTAETFTLNAIPASSITRAS